MSTLSSKDTTITQEDVKLLDEMLSKFASYKKGSALPDNSQGRVVKTSPVSARGSGLPDYSPSYVAYTPVLALVLLKAQKRLEKLTWVLAVLTFILAILAGISIWAIVH